MKKAAVVLAEGFEEVEALTPVDLLRRAGIQVLVVGLSSPHVTGARGIRVTADLLFDELPQDLDLLILPGGMPGARNLASHGGLKILLQKRIKDNRLVAAICAAPAVVLGEQGLLKGRKFTCYPGMANLVHEAHFEEKPVVVDGPVVTSRGVGTANAFALTLVGLLCGGGAAHDVAEKCLIPWSVGA